MELEPGRYHVEASVDGYEKKSLWVTLNAGEDKTLDISLNALAAGRGKKFTNSLGMEFVLIPAGSFMMGSPSSEKGRKSDEKQHRVTLTKSFYMQTTEVTQGQWKKIMGNNPSYFKNCGDGCPVENVSWNDAQEFIRKLNKREGTDKYRLPTEAEWECACRAGSTTRFCFGDSDSRLGEYAWHTNNPSSSRTHSVARKKPNAWGLYDMHGNVWEWCQDSCDHKNGVITDTYYDGAVDPLCNRGSYRVGRGGGYYCYAKLCRSAIRFNDSPDDRYSGLGLRLVLQGGLRP